ncbi:MAG TPA: YciI family protein [Devosiaceae bacterium]|nr:YciI family protein [Devosiaceae bacterium]
MQYLLMIYANEAAMAEAKPEDVAAMRAEYAKFTQEIVQSGQFKGGEQLHPSSSATVVRVRDGKALLTDGPFAETREQLAGYYVVEAKDLDEAAGLAARIPGARNGAIEVRPMVLMQQEDLQRFGRA